MPSEGLALAVLIFVLRVLNNALGTIRIIAMTNGNRALVFTLAFVESCIFAYTAGQVLTNLTDTPNFIAYSLGFAVGGFVGMWIESNFVKGYVTVNVISPDEGHKIALKLRESNYAVTLNHAEGAKGDVTVLRAVVNRRDSGEVLDIVNAIDDSAFVTLEEARAVHHGWVNRRLLRR